MESIGYCRKTGDSLTGITYQEIQSWCEMTGEHFTAWEVDTLRRISSTYALETMKSTQKDYRCPIEFEDVAERNKRLDAIFA